MKHALRNKQVLCLLRASLKVMHCRDLTTLKFSKKNVRYQYCFKYFLEKNLLYNSNLDYDNFAHYTTANF